MTGACSEQARAIRQKVLEDFGVLDDIPDENLISAVKLAALATECQSAFISFVDWKGGKIRFKHNVGMAFSEAPITPGESFCDISVMDPANVYIPDTSKHPYYCKSRFVVGQPNIACYFSVGLILDPEAGVPVGVLCAIDTKPRELRDEQVRMMTLIAKDVVRQLQLKRTLAMSQKRIAELHQDKHSLEITLSNKALVADNNNDTVQIQQTLNAQFMAALSHELRTPTNIIQCSTLLLQNTPINDEQAEYIQCIQEGVNQLQNVLDKSVEHLDTTSRTLRSNPVQFEVHKLIEKVLAECHSTNYQIGNRELLLPVIEVSVPPVLIGDSAKISQILGYFLENSVKFTDAAGKIGAHVTLHKESKRDGKSIRRSLGDEGGTVMVDFSVYDNGVGMNNDTRALLFKPLIQGDRGTTRRHGGMGFGLVTSQNLATLVNGSISVASIQKGKEKRGRRSNSMSMGGTPFPYAHGSIFTLSVPLFRPLIHTDPMSIDPLSPPSSSPSSPTVSLSQVRLSPLTAPIASVEENSTRPRSISTPSTSTPSSPSASPPKSSPIGSPISPLLGPFNKSRLHVTIPPPIEKSSLSPPTSPPPHFSSPSPPITFPPRLSSSPLSPHLTATSTLPTHDMSAIATKSKNSRILVVEDNALNMKVLTKMLEKMGFTPDYARDGAQAISKFTEDPDYSLILMDLHMPVMDGLTATRMILDIASGLGRHTKIVAVTSSVSLEVRKDCFATGMSGFIAKPISFDALVKVLNSLAN